MALLDFANPKAPDTDIFLYLGHARAHDKWWPWSICDRFDRDYSDHIPIYAIKYRSMRSKTGQRDQIPITNDGDRDHWFTQMLDR